MGASAQPAHFGAIVGACRGTPSRERQVVTDEAGGYRDTSSFHLGDEFCVDVRVVSANGDGGGVRSSGMVRPFSNGNPFAEIPRVRIDLTVEE